MRKKQVRKMGWLAAVAAFSLLTTPAVALDPPDQILAAYYIWGDYADKCAGRSPEITPEAHDAVRKSVQAVEQMVLNSTPESEREQFKQRVMQVVAAEMAKIKRQYDSDQKVCDNVGMLLASWSIYTMNLEATLNEIQRLRREGVKQ